MSIHSLLRNACLIVLLQALVACATWQAPEAPESDVLRDRATRVSAEDVGVRALVLDRYDGERLFGVDVFSHGIEPVWIEVTNYSDQNLYLLPSGVDPDYFSANEVSWMFHSSFSGKKNQLIDAHFQSIAFHRGAIPPGGIRSGVLFTNPHVGVKLLNFDLFGEDRFVSLTMFLPIPDEQGEVTDRPRLRYQVGSVPDYGGEEEFHLALNQLFSGPTAIPMEELSSPLSLVWVGHREDVAASLVRRGYRWESKPVAQDDRLFGRSPLSIMRKWGQGGSPENWVRFWEAPMTFSGRSVFFAQTGAPRGGRFATRLSTPSVDPAFDHARDMLLQDMLYSGALAKLSIMPAAVQDTRFDQMTDGKKAVLFIAGRSIDLDEVLLTDWSSVDWAVEPEPYDDR